MRSWSEVHQGEHTKSDKQAINSCVYRISGSLEDSRRMHVESKARVPAGVSAVLDVEVVF